MSCPIGVSPSRSPRHPKANLALREGGRIPLDFVVKGWRCLNTLTRTTAPTQVLVKVIPLKNLISLIPLIRAPRWRILLHFYSFWFDFSTGLVQV